MTELVIDIQPHAKPIFAATGTICMSLMCLRHHLKALLPHRRMPVPAERLFASSDEAARVGANHPVLGKAQVPAGERDNASGMVRAAPRSWAVAAVRDVMAETVKEHAVRQGRFQQPSSSRHSYLSLTLNPRALASQHSGIDVEALAGRLYRSRGS